MISLLDQLHRGNTRENRDAVAAWVVTDVDRFAELMKIYLSGDKRDAQLAAGALFCVVETHPQMITPWLPKIVKRMDQKGIHPAVRRVGVSTLQHVDIPRALQGRVVNACFRYLSDPSEPIAIRVFSMTVIARIAELEPGLIPELRQTIEASLPYGTGAFRARARMVLERLDNVVHRVHGGDTEIH